MQTQVLGLSVDSVPCLKAWADSLGGITYPLLSDFYPHGGVARKFGVLRKEGYTERAIFIMDKEGFIRYVDIHDIDKQPDNDVLFNILGKIDPQAGAWAAQHPLKATASSPIQQADLIMYCTTWCPGCRKARQYFQENNIPFVEIDITRDREAAARVRSYANGNETTPTFDIQGQIIVDYDLEKIKGALAAIKKAS
jgi:peroxiredoxin